MRFSDRRTSWIDAVAQALARIFGGDDERRGPGSPVLVPIPIRSDRLR